MFLLAGIGSTNKYLCWAESACLQKHNVGEENLKRNNDDDVEKWFIHSDLQTQRVRVRHREGNNKEA